MLYYLTDMISAPALSTIIIDFDDTLCMTEQACFELENEILARMGRDPQPRTVHKETWGMQIDKAMPIRSPGIDMDAFRSISQSVHQEFVADERIDQIPTENLAALDTLARQGYQLFILTSRTEAEAIHLLDPAHHLAGRITEIYHADSTTHIKPDPRVFDTLLSTYGLAAGNCVYIGDSPSDGVAAKGAGMHFIASFESGIRSEEDFSGTVLDATVHHFSEVPSVLERLKSKIAA